MLDKKLRWKLVSWQLSALKFNPAVVGKHYIITSDPSFSTEVTLKTQLFLIILKLRFNLNMYSNRRCIIQKSIAVK